MDIKSFLIYLFFLFLGFQLIGCNTNSDPKIDDELALIPCQNGLADTYSCNNVDLYAHVPLSELLIDSDNQRLNDIWGWQDEETGKEYALVGLTDGVTFVDVTDPIEPVVVGKLMEPAGVQKRPAGLMSNHDEEDFKGESNWRDLKVYKNTLYVVSEQNGHGMQVFDLTQLRDINEDNAPVFFEDNESNRYTQFDNAHNLAINEETGFAYIVGITSGDVCSEFGGLHMVNINTPLEPEFAGCYFDEEAGHRFPGYIHDTQCVIYNGPDSDYSGQEICFSSAENSLLITNVSEKLLATTISINFYEGNVYSHQGWLAEDQRYFMMNDELDERVNQHATRTYIWNVEDLDNPVMTGYYDHETHSIDHNLYILDDVMYQANYTSGLRVLDVSNPTPDGVVEMGFFDTTQGPDNLNFEGLWSVYPWLSGDKVIASDIENGLFIFRVER